MTRSIAMLSTLAALAAASVPSASSAAEPGAPLETVVQGNTAFALDLYGRLAAEPGNLFFSPASISSALAMTYAGARGDTAAEMAAVLRFPAGVHPAMGLLTRQFNAGSDEFELSVANALWGQEGCAFLDEFVALVDEHYGAALNRVDFQRTEDARRQINRWVAKRTRQKILELLKPSHLDPATRLVLTNAIHFKGLWQTEFGARATRDLPFHTAPDQTVSVPMMHKRASFGYAARDGLHVVRLPYKGDALSMIVLVPERVDGLPAIERALTPEALDAHLAALRDEEISLSLPRFSSGAEFELGDVLAAMGMPHAFSGAADFSGMTGRPDLFISAVVHKAVIDVDEKGTEAAAATAVVMEKVAMPAVHVIADRPFLYLIRDERNGSILFLGRLVNPAA